MPTFSQTISSQARVAAPREQIWHALTDPDVLPRLTPLLRSIRADGDVWHWQMAGLNVLGVRVDPSFTEQMTFTPMTRIDYVHTPPRGVTERAGAAGWYVLEDMRDGQAGTRLSISLTLDVVLPLPRISGAAVGVVMRTTMQQMGDRFAGNLERHLGVGASNR